MASVVEHSISNHLLRSLVPRFYSTPPWPKPSVLMVDREVDGRKTEYNRGRTPRPEKAAESGVTLQLERLKAPKPSS